MRGASRRGRHGMVMQGPLRCGWSWYGRRGKATPVVASRGKAGKVGRDAA